VKYEPDFSRINFEYLLLAQDVAKQNSRIATHKLGIHPEFIQLFSEITPQALSHIIQIKEPLLTLRQEPLWWGRFFKAIDSGAQDEIKFVLEHVSIITATQPGGNKL